MASIDAKDVVMAQNEQQLLLGLVTQFNDATNRHDVDAMMAMMTNDCIFDNTQPAPDGTLYKGQAAIRRFWTEFFASSPHAQFAVEEMFVFEDRACQRWLYTWVDAQGVNGHVRGVDVFRFRDGLIAEKLAYVKG